MYAKQHPMICSTTGTSGTSGTFLWEHVVHVVLQVHAEKQHTDIVSHMRNNIRCADHQVKM
jgi:accessory colonization factor AcfC